MKATKTTVKKSSRQKDDTPGRAEQPKLASSKKGKRALPVFELVILLLLFKIGVGIYYVAGFGGEATSGGRESMWSTAAAPSPVALEELTALAEAAKAISEELEQKDKKSPEPKAQEVPTASITSEPQKVSQASEAAKVSAPQLEAANTPEPKPSKVDEYLAAAAQVVSPAVAEAQSPATQTVTQSAVSAGALMVFGGQSTAADVGRTDSGIPLPPGADDLLLPSAALPQPEAPRLVPTTRERQGAQVSADPAELARLRDREQALARQEAMLASKEEALVTLEQELSARLATIEGSRGEMDAMLQRNEAILAEIKALREEEAAEQDKLRAARIQHLVTAYGGMKPEQAGNLVNSLDDTTAVQILAAMSGRKAGLILAFVAPEKAARLTKAISDMRTDPTLLLEENPIP